MNDCILMIGDILVPEELQYIKDIYYYPKNSELDIEQEKKDLEPFYDNIYVLFG